MKSLFFIFSFFCFIGCSNHTQEKQGKVIIDKKLKNDFFEESYIGYQGGPTKTYINSVLVDSSDNYGEEIWYNANIRDSDHHSFNSCNSFFWGDTLIVEFKGTIGFSEDRLRIKIINNEFFASYIKDNSDKEYVVIPKSLKLREKINKKGQEIFGELEIEFHDPETNHQYAFKGPFMCVVE